MKSKASAKPALARPAILDWTPSPLILLGLAAAGLVLIAIVHNFRATASVLFLTMAWFSIVGAAAILWKVGLLVAAGDEGDDGGFEFVSSRLDELRAEKASLLKAIKEVEFDRMMGKLSEADAAEITAVYRRRAIRILKEIDSAEAQASSDAEATATETIADRIERDLRARAKLSRADAGTAQRAKKAKERAVEEEEEEPAEPASAKEEEE